MDIMRRESLTQKDNDQLKFDRKSTKIHEINSSLIATVDQIWNVYDSDGNNTLDITEAKNFMQDYLQSMNLEVDYDEKTFE